MHFSNTNTLQYLKATYNFKDSYFTTLLIIPITIIFELEVFHPEVFVI